MPQKLTDIQQLREYMCGVMQRAAHHTENVEEIVIVIAGAIVWCKDDEPIEVLARDGEMKNVLWVYINKQRLAFSYDHTNYSIMVREGTTQGKVIRRFTNRNSAADVVDFFRKCKGQMASAVACTDANA